jgi:hypothetical protein
MPAEEQLEQDFNSSYRILSRFSQPLSQGIPSPARQRIDIALRFPLLLFGMTASYLNFAQINGNVLCDGKEF